MSTVQTLEKSYKLYFPRRKEWKNIGVRYFKRGRSGLRMAPERALIPVRVFTVPIIGLRTLSYLAEYAILFQAEIANNDNEMCPIGVLIRRDEEAYQNMFG